MPVNNEARQQVAALTRTTIKLKDIKIDDTLYPRYRESSGTIHQYAEAMRGGAEFPPLVIDQDKRLIDGLHRYRAYEMNGVETVTVERQRVKDEVDFFRRAMTANAHHGHRYTGIDYAHMVLRGKELGISEDDIARLVYVTPGFLAEATRDWFAINQKSEQVAIKRTIKHMRGRKLTAEQLEANKKIGGMQQTFYVNQVLLLLENDLVDTDNPKLMERLTVLQEALGTFFMGQAKKRRA